MTVKIDAVEPNVFPEYEKISTHVMRGGILRCSWTLELMANKPGHC